MSPWFQLFLILASVVGVLMWVGMTFWFSLNLLLLFSSQFTSLSKTKGVGDMNRQDGVDVCLDRESDRLHH